MRVFSGSSHTNSFLHRFLIRRRGRRDGLAKIPRLDEQEPSEQERQLLVRGTQHTEQIAGRYSDAVERAKAELQRQIEQFQMLLTAFEEEMTRFNKRRQDLRRDVVTTYISQRWYRIFLITIALGEFALNTQAFEVFQKPLLLTWLMALTLAVGIPLSAHFCGLWIRQWPKPAWATGVKLAATLAVTAACLVGINRAREFYLVSEHLSSGPQSALLEHAFLAINFFVFAVATLLSHFAHDEDYQLENLHKRVSKLDRKLDVTDSGIYRWSGKLEGMCKKANAELEETRAIILELILLYREANRLARDGERPEAFKIAPTLGIPNTSQWSETSLGNEVAALRARRYQARKPEPATQA